MLPAHLTSFLEFTSLVFREAPPQPGSSQHYNFKKPAADSIEFHAARKTVAAFFPAAAGLVRIEPLQPGNSGMWPFKVTTSTTTCLLKIASPDADINISDQAARARWAGVHGLGPVVLGEDREKRAYVTQLIEGSVLSHEQAAGEKKAAIARALRKVHTADRHELTAAEFVAGPENWLFCQDLPSLLRGSANKEISFFENELVSIYRRSDEKLGKMQYAQAPTHNDVKADNAFAVGREVIFIDWDNLKLSDPMTDLAHFLWSVDAPAASAKPFLNDYYGSDAVSCGERDEALVRLQLRLFQVRLRSFAFFGQYEENAPNTRFYQYLLKDDIAAIVPLL